MPGKISASLSDKLKDVEWGEYKLNDLFYVKTAKGFDEGKLNIISNKKEGLIEFIGRTRADNGVKGYVKRLEINPNNKDVISISQVGTITAQIRKSLWYASQNIFILESRQEERKMISLFVVSAINKALNCFSDGYSYYPTLESLKKLVIKLPIKNEEIDYAFMDNFIEELEKERIEKLSDYLKASGLDDFVLTDEEQKIIHNFKKLEWKTYNLEELFGKSTRGKRLKSEDRIPGKLPFVTAGEAHEGVSDFIGNKVHIFSKNTTTIDMFGSAKYRNYEYGGDDHVAIVHTEKLPMNAAIFVTTAIHKSSHNGQFDYGRNFYAKDADELDILLPTKDGKIDIESMDTFISAIHKLVIKDVVLYVNKKTEATKKVINNS